MLLHSVVVSVPYVSQSQYLFIPQRPVNDPLQQISLVTSLHFPITHAVQAPGIDVAMYSNSISCPKMSPPLPSFPLGIASDMYFEHGNEKWEKAVDFHT